MKNFEHTPEPWATVHHASGQQSLIQANQKHLAECWSMDKEINSEANAARIVQCVNACAGMDDPAAEIAALRARIEELTKPTEQPTIFDRLNVYPLDKKDYPEVKRVLEGMGYILFGSEWMEDEDCVTTTGDGFLMTHHYSKVKRFNKPTYTFTEFMAKYATPAPTEQPTTVEGWLKLLPDGYRERALVQMDEGFKDCYCVSLNNALGLFQLWETTNEKEAFWRAVRNHYAHGTPLPKLPTN